MLRILLILNIMNIMIRITNTATILIMIYHQLMQL